MKTCEFCQTEFYSTDSRQKYCSSKCQIKHRDRRDYDKKKAKRFSPTTNFHNLPLISLAEFALQKDTTDSSIRCACYDGRLDYIMETVGFRERMLVILNEKAQEYCAGKYRPPKDRKIGSLEFIGCCMTEHIYECTSPTMRKRNQNKKGVLWENVPDNVHAIFVDGEIVWVTQN